MVVVDYDRKIHKLLHCTVIFYTPIVIGQAIELFESVVISILKIIYFEIFKPVFFILFPIPSDFVILRIVPLKLAKCYHNYNENVSRLNVFSAFNSHSCESKSQKGPRTYVYNKNRINGIARIFGDGSAASGVE